MTKEAMAKLVYNALEAHLPDTCTLSMNGSDTHIQDEDTDWELELRPWEKERAGKNPTLKEETDA